MAHMEQKPMNLRIAKKICKAVCYGGQRYRYHHYLIMRALIYLGSDRLDILAASKMKVNMYYKRSRKAARVYYMRVNSILVKEPEV